MNSFIQPHVLDTPELSIEACLGMSSRCQMLVCTRRDQVGINAE